MLLDTSDAYKEAMEKRNMEVAEDTIIQCIGMTPKAIVDHPFGEMSDTLVHGKV